MKNIFQSSLHLLLVLYLFYGCDVKHDIVLPLVEEGTAYGYDIDEVKTLKVIDMRGILLNFEMQEELLELLPKVKLYLSPPCNCTF